MLSLNNKNTQAEKYSVKSPEKVIIEVCKAISNWESISKELEIPERVYNSIKEDFTDYSNRL